MKLSNELVLFERPMNGSLFPYQVVPAFLAIVGMLVGFVMSLPPMVSAGPYVLLISSLLGLFTIIGHRTHVAREFNYSQMEAWQSYKNLPDSLKQGIMLDAKTLAAMDNRAASKLETKFNELISVHRNRVAEESKANGRHREVFDAVDNAIEHEEGEYKLARGVNEYMDRKEIA